MRFAALAGFVLTVLTASPLCAAGGPENAVVVEFLRQVGDACCKVRLHCHDLVHQLQADLALLLVQAGGQVVDPGPRLAHRNGNGGQQVVAAFTEQREPVDLARGERGEQRGYQVGVTWLTGRVRMAPWEQE